MTDYRNSRHKARWIFQPSALVKKREAANARAVNRLQQYGASNFEITSNTMPLWQPEEEILFSNDGENPRQPLTVNEEALVRRSYEFRIQQTCADLNFPHVVQATVIIFFKRFYLEWSVMDFPLDCIMLACVFLGTKVEEHEFSFEDLTAHLKQKAKVVNEYEMLILQSLEFDIAVYTPYLPCDGFGFDMEDFFVPVDGTCMSLKGLRDAKQYIDRLMLTDVPLIYNPGLIALAALYKVNEQHKLADFDRYLEHVCNIRCDLSVENLEGACRQIISYLESDEQEAEADTIKDIEQRLEGLQSFSLPHPLLEESDANAGFSFLGDSDFNPLYSVSKTGKFEWETISPHEMPDATEMYAGKPSSERRNLSPILCNNGDDYMEILAVPGFGECSPLAKNSLQRDLAELKNMLYFDNSVGSRSIYFDYSHKNDDNDDDNDENE